MRVLVVDDEIRNAELTALEMRDAGHDADFVSGGDVALQRMEASPYEAVITDLRMKPPDGLALLDVIRQRWPRTTVVLMTAYATMESARRALKGGAYDYVDKEGEFREELKSILERAARERDLEARNLRLESTVDSLTRGLATIVGDSPATRRAIELSRKVAATDSTVLLLGESGSGKDLFARAIHFTSRRAAGPWVKVNCGALPENLLETELFGHEKGAFTGAVRQKPGRFEDAQRGTIFLDEIGELPIALQVKLLQVIEEKTFTRVGGNQPLTVRAYHRSHQSRSPGDGERQAVPGGPLLPAQRVPGAAAVAARAALRHPGADRVLPAPPRRIARQGHARGSASVRALRLSRQRARAGAHPGARDDPRRGRPDRGRAPLFRPA